MHPGMLKLRELNERIGNLRGVRVSQVVREGPDVEITFAAAAPFIVKLQDVILFVDHGLADAPLAAGIAFTEAADRVELWIDDLNEDGSVACRLQALASKVTLHAIPLR